jgi:Spy/CpxP family protein refolding chaperone
MKPHLVWVLLIASLGFNGFFAVGYANARRMASDMQSFEGRARMFARGLDLDARQAEVFEQMLAQLAKKRAESRRARLPHAQMLLAELAKDLPDEQVLSDYAQQDFTRDYRLATVHVMRDFLKVLRPEQKQVLLQMLEQKIGSGS